MEMKECQNVTTSSTFIHKNARLESPVNLGRGTEIHADCSIGKYTFINNYSVLYPNVTIGKYCSIGRSVEISVASHPTHFLSTHLFQFESTLFPHCIDYTSIKHVKKPKWLHEPTVIGNDVWIGGLHPKFQTI